MLTLARQFRVFAGDSNEKRLRFKPMISVHRAFLHALAEDYGFDSESLDPDPHRHVVVFKTPRFVSAPTKPLRDAWRIRQNHLREEGKELIASAQAKVSHSSVLPRPQLFVGFVRWGDQGCLF